MTCWTLDLIQKYQIVHPGDPRILWFYPSGAKHPPSTLTPPIIGFLSCIYLLIGFQCNLRARKAFQSYTGYFQQQRLIPLQDLGRRTMSKTHQSRCCCKGKTTFLIWKKKNNAADQIWAAGEIFCLFSPTHQLSVNIADWSHAFFPPPESWKGSLKSRGLEEPRRAPLAPAKVTHSWSAESAVEDGNKSRCYSSLLSLQRVI